MNISIASSPLPTLACDLLAVGVPEGAVASAVASLEATFGGKVAQTAQDEEFTGKAGSSVSWPGFGMVSAGRLLLVGLGSGSVDEVRRAAGIAGSMSRQRGYRHAALAFGRLDTARTAAAVEGFGIGNYRFERYKPTSDRRAAAERLTLVGEADERAFPAAVAILAGMSMARDLVNESPAVMYPETLAEAAATLAGQGLSVEIWDERRIKDAGMGGIASVGQGSDRPPRFVHMTWTPVGRPAARVAVVGKGVTFDSGGLSLKTSQGMQTMRCDMAGSASVIGLMRALRELRPDVLVHGIFAAAENMPSGESYKLGDVLRMYNGKTVEIHNTDAEGRLLLGDCLTYASRLGVDAIVDMATLTGACVVALGEFYSGLFTQNDALAATLLARAEESGEGVWRLPLAEVYRDKLKADWANLKNVGGREAGAITAALFLSEFVENTPWAHLDIAGPAFYEKPFRHFAPGGTGALVPTLTRWILGLAS